MTLIQPLLDCWSMDRQFMAMVHLTDDMAHEHSWSIDFNVARLLWMEDILDGNGAYTWPCMSIPCHPWYYGWYKCFDRHRNAMEALWTSWVQYLSWKPCYFPTFHPVPSTMLHPPDKCTEMPKYDNLTNVFFFFFSVFHFYQFPCLNKSVSLPLNSPG